MGAHTSSSPHSAHLWPEGVIVMPPPAHLADDAVRVLTPDCLAFVAMLTRAHRPTVNGLLAARQARQDALDAGGQLDFLEATRDIRQAPWQAAPIPADLADRRVEITGPPTRKMVINALNSGANVFMADFEDSCAPTWSNLIAGQRNLCDAVRRTIRVDDESSGKVYTLADAVATLMVRPRGWHLWEPHVEVDGAPVPAGLFDFAVYFFHNVEALRAAGTGAYFYLPKIQAHQEAVLWRDVFADAEVALGVPGGIIRATVLIETLPAAFEMDEIIYALKDNIAGLNCGRWDYIFSFIKTRRADPEAILCDRALASMTQPCMRAYSQLLIRTCHRRGIHAMGGMAAQIPIKDDPAANAQAQERVKADKLREVTDGHDGTWVAHPGLVPLARDIFDAHMPGPNQLQRHRSDVNVSPADLLQVPEGARTVAGLRQNIEIGVRYLAAWLSGQGCVPIHNLMEDAATAEISRAQVWQWLHHGVGLEVHPEHPGARRETVILTRELFKKTMAEELHKLDNALGTAACHTQAFTQACALFEEMCMAPTLADFLTVQASQTEAFKTLS